MFILSQGMIRTGALEFVSEKIIAYSQGNAGRVMALSMLIVAVTSAFINNAPVVVLFISILMSVCCEYDLSPSKFMIPVSYASILAGTSTLIGTSTNILISDLSSSSGYGSIGMFELAVLGAPIAAAGILFLYFAAPRFMPGHKAPVCELADKEDRRYLAELSVPEQSKLVGQDPIRFLAEKYPTIEVFEVIRGPSIFFVGNGRIHVREGDLLFVKASASDLIAGLGDKLFELSLGSKEKLDFHVHGGSIFVELIVPPQSRMAGAGLLGSELLLDPDIQIIAVKRRGVHYSQQKLRELRLTVGDVLLVHCPKNRLDHLRASGDFIIVEDVHHRIVVKKKAPLAMAIFAGMIVAATLGLADIMICAVSAVFLMGLTGCIQLRDAYRAVAVRVLMLIIGTIALGAAMEKTGVAGIYANAFLTPFQGQSPAVALSAFIFLASLSTQILSNNATAILLVPIGISTAVSLGVDPRPFIIGLCYGASACYATPIGYKTNLFVYGPGGYRFSDYLKLGIPLSLFVWIVSSLFIPFIWPF
jgi:di/tricarboxylate transporter